MKDKVSSLKGNWFAIIMFGLIGQIAWNIENMYFNTYLFNYIGGTTSDIAFMVGASAVTATLTALFMGALSDKLNKRKFFICVGTILWGISTLSLAFISRDSVSAIFGGSVNAVLRNAVIAVIVVDCIMTFFGSMSNDGAFNSWVTDITDGSNRSRVEGVLSSFPMVAMLIVVGVSGILIDALGYPVFFVVIGILVSICGIIGMFVIKESRSGAISSDSYWKSIVQGFNPKIVAKNVNLYLFLVALALFYIGTNIFMPYLIIYLEKYLGFDAFTYSLILALGVLLSAVSGVLLSRKINEENKMKFVFPSLMAYIIGLVMVFFFKSVGMLIFSICVALIGNVLSVVVLNSGIREHTPKDNVGMFQGVRMIFYVLVPMVVGPAIGNMIIESSNQTYVNEFAEVVNVPVPAIFLAGAIFTLLVFIPLLIYAKKNKALSK